MRELMALPHQMVKGVSFITHPCPGEIMWCKWGGSAACPRTENKCCMPDKHKRGSWRLCYTLSLVKDGGAECLVLHKFSPTMGKLEAALSPISICVYNQAIKQRSRVKKEEH
eukprot:5754169-Ditylum_brightwellii.AAC.1